MPHPRVRARTPALQPVRRPAVQWDRRYSETCGTMVALFVFHLLLGEDGFVIGLASGKQVVDAGAQSDLSW